MSYLSGFQEFLPTEQYIFDQWKSILTHHFKSFALCPLETASIERMATLLSKGNDHEIYGIHRFKDTAPKSELGLRFDLTVPLARYVAYNQGQLTFPYRRYQIAPVWRGERPQEGRYRQFYQCDIDIIGRDTLSYRHDAEVPFIMQGALKKLSVESSLGPIVWMVNHRKILNAWIQFSGISGPDAHLQAMRTIDKRGKVPFSEILGLLKDMGAHMQALTLLESWTICPTEVQPCLDFLKKGMGIFDAASTVSGQEGLKEMAMMTDMLEAMHFPMACLRIDPLLARGLTYYSGVLYEAIIENAPSLGAICAGGRYDDLVSGTSGKPAFPGVGASIGISRLFSAFIKKNTGNPRFGHVLITVQDPENMGIYLKLAEKLRGNGFSTEVYLEPNPLPKQIKYAHAKGFPFVIIANKEECANQYVQIKTMEDGQQHKVTFDQMIGFIQNYLSV